MKIYNTTTEKEVSLTIIDVKTRCEWTADLISAGNLDYNEELEMTEMSQDDFEWWSDLIEKMESNDERISEIESGLDEEDLDSFRNGIADCCGNDLDTDADRIQLYLDEYDKNN